MTNTTYNPAMNEYDPVAAVVHYIQQEMFGLVRRDADAVANGWDPREYPANGHIWQEAERQLLAASGDEELDDDTYADLADAIADILPDPEDMDNEEEE